jgi:hypothetical protein
MSMLDHFTQEIRIDCSGFKSIKVQQSQEQNSHFNVAPPFVFHVFSHSNTLFHFTPTAYECQSKIPLVFPTGYPTISGELLSFYLVFPSKTPKIRIPEIQTNKLQFLVVRKCGFFYAVSFFLRSNGQDAQNVLL